MIRNGVSGGKARIIDHNILSDTQGRICNSGGNAPKGFAEKGHRGNKKAVVKREGRRIQ